MGTVMLQLEPVQKVTCRKQRGTLRCLCLCGHVRLSLTCTDSWFPVALCNEAGRSLLVSTSPAGCHITSVPMFSATFSY